MADFLGISAPHHTELRAEIAWPDRPATEPLQAAAAISETGA